MKRFMFLWLPLALALMACSPNPLAPEVSGNLDGDWSDLGNIDVALFGATTELATLYDTQFQLVDGNFTGGYRLSIPAMAPEGIYQVVAFVDNNNNNSLDLLEVVGNSGRKYLVYRDTDLGSFKAGWNAVEGLTGEPESGFGFRDFDLQRIP